MSGYRPLVCLSVLVGWFVRELARHPDAHQTTLMR